MAHNTIAKWMWMFSLLLLANFGMAQSSMSSSGSGTWNAPTFQTSFGNCGGSNQPECWHLMPGSAMVITSDLGHTFAVNSSNQGFTYNEFPTNSWTYHSEWGAIGMLHYGSDGNTYALVGPTCGNGGYYVSKWTGKWTAVLNCYHVDFDIAKDSGGLILGIGTDGALYGSPNFGSNGVSVHYPMPSNHGTVVSVAVVDSNGTYGDYYLAMSDNSLWFCPNGVCGQLSGGAGTHVAFGSDESLYVIGTDAAVYHRNSSGGWDKLPFYGITSLATSPGTDVWAIGPTSNGQNIYRFSSGQLVFSRSYSGTVSCAQGVPEAECETFHHTAALQLSTSQATGQQVQATAWNGNGQWGMTATVPADVVACLDNPFLDGCAPNDNGNMNCSGGGSNNDVPQPILLDWKVFHSRMKKTGSPSQDRVTKQWVYPTQQECSNTTNPQWYPNQIWDESSNDVAWDTHGLCFTIFNSPYFCLYQMIPKGTGLIDKSYTSDPGTTTCDPSQ